MLTGVVCARGYKGILYSNVLGGYRKKQHPVVLYFLHCTLNTAQVRNKLSAEQYKNVVTMVVSGDYVK